MSDLSALVELSNRYGSDPDWVLAGGGNSSFKDGDTLYVKASGTALGTIDAGGFCAIDRAALGAIWTRRYPAGADEREAAVLADLMAARLPGETRRPSVETLMHGLFPQAYVLHSHPCLVNGLCCGRGGRAAFDELFADLAVWVPFVEPGYVLAKAVKDAVQAFQDRVGSLPAVMLMQNHGLVVAADDLAGVDRLSAEAASRLASRLGRRPDHSAAAVSAAQISAAASALAELASPGAAILHRADAECLGRAASRGAFAPLASAFTPDHIVYAGHEFLYAEEPGGLPAAWKDYAARNGCAPKLAVVGGAGAFALCPTEKASRTALALFADACKIAAYAESFGGPLHMEARMIDFIRNWEVEKYRASVGK